MNPSRGWARVTRVHAHQPCGAELSDSQLTTMGESWDVRVGTAQGDSGALWGHDCPSLGRPSAHAGGQRPRLGTRAAWGALPVGTLTLAAGTGPRSEVTRGWDSSELQIFVLSEVTGQQVGSQRSECRRAGSFWVLWEGMWSRPASSCCGCRCPLCREDTGPRGQAPRP